MKTFRIVLLICCLFMIACGGGGGDSAGSGNTPITSTRTYFVDDDGYYESGYRLQFNLSGSSNTRDIFTGTYSLSTKSRILVYGELVTPVDELINLDNVDTGATITVLTTTYYDTNQQPFLSINQIEGEACIPSETVARPGIAMIGDFGLLTPWECDDGTSSSGTWILEPGPGENAIYKNTINSYDSLGTLIGTVRIFLTIDESGDPKSISLEFNYPAQGINLVLNGVRVLK